MSPLLRRTAAIGAIALTLLILGMLALAALKAAWVAVQWLAFFALIVGLPLALWLGWKRWRRRRE